MTIIKLGLQKDVFTYFDERLKSKPDKGCLTAKAAEICRILKQQESQLKYVKGSFLVRGGEKFPQNKPIELKIKDAIFKGIMAGELFSVTEAIHPQSETIKNPPCQAVNPSAIGYRPDADECQPTGDLQKTIVGGSSQSWDLFRALEEGEFLWLPPGTEVLLNEDSDDLHIVSLMPGVVNQVAAYRTHQDISLLTEVPSSYYTVVTSDFGGYDVVEVRLPVSLSRIEGEDWEDDLYVSFTSSVGPNPVDSIEWLLSTYTSYEIDTASFLDVKTLLANYPANFYVKARPGVMDLIKDICYQSRCSVIIRDNKVILKYLPKKETPVRTLTTADIVSRSFSFTHTTTEKLETRQTIKWSEGDASIIESDPTSHELVLKHNIPNYGIFDASYDYFTHNHFPSVQKTATFWLIRKANTWRRVKFSTPIMHLDLDVFDTVTLDIPNFPKVPVIIERSTYNADQNIVEFEAWTPVLSGSAREYKWAWPADQGEFDVFPGHGLESSTGDGYKPSVTPPIGHPLRVGYDPDVLIEHTGGDLYPSDAGDAFLQVTCRVASSAEVANDILPKVEVDAVAAASFSADLKEKQAKPAATPGGATIDKKESKQACGEPMTGQIGCVFEVIVQYITPTLIGDGCGGPCSTGGPPGVACNGSFHHVCHTFGALFAAQAFAAEKNAEGEAKACGHEYLVTAPYTAGAATIRAISVDTYAGECPDVGTPASPTGTDLDHDQITAPGLASGNPATWPPSVGGPE